MGTILNRSKYALVLLLTLFATTSCFFDGSDDDNAAEWSMVGTWYVRQSRRIQQPLPERRHVRIQEQQDFLHL